MAKLFSLWLVAMLAVLTGCRTAPKAGVPRVDPRAAEHVSAGDARFIDHHLYGWRQAELAYAKAYELAPSPELYEKLLLTRFLIVTRERDEDILSPRIDEVVNATCSAPATSRIRPLCDLVRVYRDGIPDAGARNEKNKPMPAVFNFDGGVLDAYLREVYRRSFGGEDPDPVGTFEAYKDSPLFVYLYMGRKTAVRAIELEKAFPEFAELFAFTGEEQFLRNRFTTARTYFSRALELVPDYTRALNGLGNLYFFVLEDWQKALEYYESALSHDSSNTAALFGKGACLHHLRKHTESNDAMLLMLQGDLSRHGRASAESVRYYQVEGNYYQASNYSLMGRRDKAREFIEAARRIVPYTEHVTHLSAVNNFEDGRKEEARKELELLMQRGTSYCDTRYFLGRLHREANDPACVDQFLGACSCMQGAVASMQKQIRSLPGFDLTPEERVVLQGRLEKKLLDYRMESTRLIEIMLKLTHTAEHPQKNSYLEMMTEVLDRIRPENDTITTP